nr:MAG TPA: hypothetical protein [Caudoviricetes sp.]
MLIFFANLFLYFHLIFFCSCVKFFNISSSSSLRI